MSDKDLIKNQVLAIKEIITSGEDHVYMPSEEDGRECDYKTAESISAYDWLEGALDIKYKIDSNGDCIGGEVLVCFGGPTVWVDTEATLIRGYWWGDTCLMHYHDDPMGLNDAVIELWGCR
tara:strand:+ start:9458 stop:9820 length:363 start_codon:yes stop_codon:yes gene_type:complete